jgi:hypothetical protein
MSDHKNPVLPEEENISPAEEPDLSLNDAPEGTADTPVEKKPRVKSRFLQFLLIWLAVLLVLGAATCFVLYRYAAVYEETRPEKPMEQMMESLSKDDWLDKAAPTASAYMTEFEDADALFRQYYNSSLRDYDLSFRRSLSQSDETLSTFVVMARNTSLYNVVFRARTDKNPGFGMHYWELESVSVCDFTSHLDSLRVEIETPADQPVLLNGTPMSDAYYTGDVPCPAMTELEGRFETVPVFRQYTVEAIYGNVTVTDDKGIELVPEIDTALGRIRYQVSPELYSLVVAAPEDVTVRICGADLLPQDVTGRSLGIFDGFGAYTGGNEWNTVEYSVSGLYTKPVVEAYDRDGTKLSPIVIDNGKFLFYHANDPVLQELVTPDVQAYFDAYMDYSMNPLTLARLQKLWEHTLFGTRLNRYFRDSAEGMMYASTTEVSFEDLTFTNFCPVGENSFFCTIQYKANFNAQSWYENYSYDLANGYEMYFVKSGNKWVAAEMFSFS